MAVELPPKGSFDMTWFRGSDPSPLEVAERLVEAFSGPDKELTLRELAAATGRTVPAVADRVQVMVSQRFFAPLTPDDSELLKDTAHAGEVKLRLGSRGKAILSEHVG